MSRDSIVPAFVTALAAEADTLLAGVTVCLGFQENAVGGDCLWVHCEDPYQASIGPGSTSTQKWAPLARQRDESVDVTCVIDTWNGEGDVAAAMARAYAILAPVASWMRTANWAALAPGLLQAGVTTSRLSLGLSGTSAQASLVIGVHLEARI